MKEETKYLGFVINKKKKRVKSDSDKVRSNVDYAYFSNN